MSDEDGIEDHESVEEVEKVATPKPKKAKASKSNIEETTQVFYGVDPMYQNTSAVKRAKRAE